MPKYYELPKDEWKDAISLPERIVKLVRERQTDSEEFQAILRVWGRDRVKEMYMEQIKREKGK